MKTAKPIREWFSDSFDENLVPTEVVDAFEEELADTVEDLVYVKPDEVEELLNSLDLKPKVKSKIRRAVEALQYDQRREGRAEKQKNDSTAQVATAILNAIQMSQSSQAVQIPVSPDRSPKSPRVETIVEASLVEAAPKPPTPIAVPQDFPREPGTFLVPTISKQNISGPWKTIMVVGETGCGKSTTLNSMVNYLWDVDIKDHYRFVLVPPPSAASAQAHSVTDEVTAYHLRPPKLLHGLTIIDTPGFGDTKGLAADQRIVDKIEHAFKNEIDTLDGIFFIVRSSGRLDSQMKYVFNSVLRLFGNDLVRNLFTLVTFADGATPPVLASIQEAQIPSQEVFELNNSAFFNGFQPDKARTLSPSMCVRQGDPLPDYPVPQGIIDRPHTEMFWKLGNLAMKKLFDVLNMTQPVSLQLSIGTLQLRKKLQLKIICLQKQVSNGLDKISNMRHTIDSIKRNAKEVNASADFVIKGKKNELYEVETPGRNNTTCTNCKHTCHANCAYENNVDKIHCVAMTNEKCTVCSGKCHWSAHINDHFVLKTRQVETSVVRDEIKKKFDKSTADLSFAEQAVIVISKEISEEQQNVKISIDELRAAIAELNEIAMNPSVMEEEDYYDKLIQTEEAQRTPGWKQRAVALKELKDQARTLKQVTDHSDASQLIFQSAVGQLKKDLADIQSIIGKGVNKSAIDPLKRVEEILTQTTRGSGSSTSVAANTASSPFVAANTVSPRRLVLRHKTPTKWFGYYGEL